MSDARAPRLLAIAGSPRRHGNSDALLDACVQGAEQAGATIDRLVVATAGISPCTGCNSCSKDGHCIIEDGMQQVYERIDAADAIVVATPVFFATVPAVLKALYDRCQPYWARRYVLHEPIARRRSGALLVVGGGGDPFGNTCAITTTRSVFAVLGLDYAHEVAARADKPSDVAAQPEELEQARVAGAALAADAADRIRTS
jgi:multimeric flavodoxin WrbA